MENNVKVLNVYAMYDNEIKFYDGLVFSQNDESAVSFYLSEFANIIVAMSDRKDFTEQRDRFMEKIHNASIFKVGSFDHITGQFVNESCKLVDLFDVSTEDILAKKLIKKEERKED